MTFFVHTSNTNWTLIICHVSWWKFWCLFASCNSQMFIWVFFHSFFQWFLRNLHISPPLVLEEFSNSSSSPTIVSDESTNPVGNNGLGITTFELEVSANLTKFSYSWSFVLLWNLSAYLLQSGGQLQWNCSLFTVWK